jgi:ABC-type phosphate transport system substrate-binding protein
MRTTVRTSILALLAALVCASAMAQTGPIAVITNAGTPVTNLSRAELRTIFHGDRQFWSSSLKIALLVPAVGSAERSVMLKKIYEKNESQYKQHWVAKVFRNEATSPPREISTRDLVVRFVRQTPGSLALVDASSIPGGVRVITIDGKGPNDPGYALVP